MIFLPYRCSKLSRIRRSHFARNALTPSSIVALEDAFFRSDSAGVLGAANGMALNHYPASSHLAACPSASAQVA